MFEKVPFFEPEEEVERYVSEHFDPAAVEITDYPLLRPAKLVIDHRGRSLLIYWNWLTQTLSVTAHYHSPF